VGCLNSREVQGTSTVSSPGDIAVKGMRYRWLPGPLVSRAFWIAKLEKKK